ncbi:MAG: hypothetical protein ONB46_09140 [candidate division KSB1 bacterium]|nr:hypothetical protein [candidate division KSB1 bacterium]MDZ7365965.1 hypothetical protein [candidate division KSB1 bacterium]MDZ7404081.1 hypothetical protein [candidate division KSB1 bacterium]
MKLKSIGLIFFLLPAIIFSRPAAAQLPNQVLVTRKTVPVATIKDRETINFFVEQYFIPEQKIDSIEVIDVLGDGFNEKDVLEVYPSKQLFSLSQSDTALAVMRNWKRSSFIEVVAERGKNSEYTARSNFPAAISMFNGLVRLVEKNYVGRRLTLQFDFDGSENGTASLQIWGFQEDELLKVLNPKDQFAHDMMFYTRADTIYIEKPVYDVIYIQQTVTDTVRVAAKK